MIPPKQMVHYFEIHFHELMRHGISFLFSFCYIFCVCYYFSNQLIYLFVHVLIQSETLKYFIFTDITEMFVTNIYISFVVSSYISIQVLILHIYVYLSEGLYKSENYKFLKIFLIFVIFNIFMVLVIFIKIIPNIWYFFINISFENTSLFNVYFEPSINHYFHFIFFTFFCIYLIFFYFFILFFLISNNILKIKTVIYLRKIFYFKFLIIATFISPPDILYQLLVFLFLILFFEIFIFFNLLLSKYLNVI